MLLKVHVRLLLNSISRLTWLHDKNKTNRTCRAKTENSCTINKRSAFVHQSKFSVAREWCVSLPHKTCKHRNGGKHNVEKVQRQSYFCHVGISCCSQQFNEALNPEECINNTLTFNSPSIYFSHEQFLDSFQQNNSTRFHWLSETEAHFPSATRFMMFIGFHLRSLIRSLRFEFMKYEIFSIENARVVHKILMVMFNSELRTT